MINRERLGETFRTLAQIDSPSRHEKACAQHIQKIFEALGAQTSIDESASGTGSDTGNLIVKIAGTAPFAPLFLNAHMDTVEPGNGVTVCFDNEVFTSAGTTVLGADDKSGVAVLIETARILHEQKIPHGPLEFIFTTCEEIGLLGARYLDYSKIEAKAGYTLDTSGIYCMNIKSPHSCTMTFTLYGKAAHAGSEPENGINAIVLAGKAIAQLDLGRIDEETTANIGIIRGGVATNIVPEEVHVEAEVRSHNKAKLDNITDTMVNAFKAVVEEYRHNSGNSSIPRLEFNIHKGFTATDIPRDHFVVTTAQRAAAQLGKTVELKAAGGGSDANVFLENGIISGVLGTGMTDVHSVRESVTLEDMVQTAELVVQIIKTYSEK